MEWLDSAWKAVAWICVGVILTNLWYMTKNKDEDK